jgi:hypothetical protein
MSPTDTLTVMLLAAHFLALGVATMVFFWMIFLRRRNRVADKSHPSDLEICPLRIATAIRPAIWLAVRSLEPKTVRAALPHKDEFTISPPVNGWVVVTGPGLPDPGDDVDRCFRFLTAASRQLGHLQFFQMEKFSGHHAWVRLDDGRVTRAYAWASETIWNQGAKTPAENRLGMNCCDYGENSGAGAWTASEPAAANIEKIPLLAACWSLDPEMLHRADGDAGESARF